MTFDCRCPCQKGVPTCGHALNIRRSLVLRHLRSAHLKMCWDWPRSWRNETQRSIAAPTFHWLTDSFSPDARHLFRSTQQIRPMIYVKENPSRGSKFRRFREHIGIVSRVHGQRQCGGKFLTQVRFRQAGHQHAFCTVLEFCSSTQCRFA